MIGVRRSINAKLRSQFPKEKTPAAALGAASSHFDSVRLRFSDSSPEDRYQA